jgi:hypothetical protein
MVDPEVIAAWVRASCQVQGIPEKVTDIAALREIGVLLGVGGSRTRAHGAPAPST